MGSLNPEWLAIELDSIDATVKNWSDAIQASYKAAVESAYSTTKHGRSSYEEQASEGPQ